MKEKRFKRRTYSQRVFNEMMIKRIAAFLTAAVVLVAGCKKFEAVQDNPADENRTMGSLVVSDDFSWNLFQTLDVEVILPQNEEIKPIEISSLDGKKIYFKGNSEDGTRDVVTIATLSTTVELVMIQFGDGMAYGPVIVPIMNNEITYDFNDIKKSGVRGDDDDDDDDDDDFTGSLGYEDLWPGTGDYDFNDLVIDYRFDITKNEIEQIEHITATFTIEAFGATLQNGFGFMFPNVAPNQIISVSGYDLAADTYITLSGNGIESGQSKATFILYDNVYRIMDHPGSGIGVNTDPNAPYVEPVTIVMEIDFYEDGSFGPGGPVTYSQLNIGNFNPFIIVNKVRGVEVHLPYFAPTDHVNTSIFGTSHDDSDPATGRYYVTDKNCPWAINIPQTFDYPIEKQDINGAYLNFGDWAESDGTIYPDWYENLSGYMNNALIY